MGVEYSNRVQSSTLGAKYKYFGNKYRSKALRVVHHLDYASSLYCSQYLLSHPPGLSIVWITPPVELSVLLSTSLVPPPPFQDCPLPGLLHQWSSVLLSTSFVPPPPPSPSPNPVCPLPGLLHQWHSLYCSQYLLTRFYSCKGLHAERDKKKREKWEEKGIREFP